MKNTVTTLRPITANITLDKQIHSILSLHGCEECYVSNSYELGFASNKEDAINILCRLSSILGIQITAYHRISDGDREINVIAMYKNGKIIEEAARLQFILELKGKKIKSTQVKALVEELNLATGYSDDLMVSSEKQSIEFDIKDCVMESKLFPNVTAMKAGTTITLIVD